MLTFDSSSFAQGDPLRELVERNTPDEIECGETDTFWVRVRRSTKQIELVSKETGQVIAKCAADDDARQYGLSAAQVSAAKAGLKL